jgi:putative colanic acid biosynthesis acetyltransferase WcaF
LNPLRRRHLGAGNKALRAAWNLVWLLLYRPSPVPLHAWRRSLLRLFGAQIGRGAHPYPSARIWAPWNLTMGIGSCLSHGVICYSVDKVVLGARVTISQYSYLCTASHDFTRREMPLISAPIVVHDDAWVTADVFVGPGVEIGTGAVVGARATVVKDVAAWTVVAGNPARRVGQRSFVAETAAGPLP